MNADQHGPGYATLVELRISWRKGGRYDPDPRGCGADGRV